MHVDSGSTVFKTLLEFQRSDTLEGLQLLFGFIDSSDIIGGFVLFNCIRITYTLQCALLAPLLSSIPLKFEITSNKTQNYSSIMSSENSIDPVGAITHDRTYSNTM